MNVNLKLKCEFKFTKRLFYRKKYFTEREKEHCAIFIRAHFMWGLRLGLVLS